MMPYAKREDRLAHERIRYARDGEKMRAAARAHHHANRDRILEARKQRRTDEERRAKDAADMRAYHASLRQEMIAAYGGRCACCGESEPKFLELDHTENDGAAHRRAIGRGSGVTYRALKKKGWPRHGYQLLCANCNAGKARNGGICPHAARSPDHFLSTDDLGIAGEPQNDDAQISIPA